MANLMELLAQDMGAGSTKVASAETAGDDILALASELGLGFDFDKEAGEDEDEDDKDDKKEEKKEEKKDDEGKAPFGGEVKAAAAGLGDLFGELFPDEAPLTVKTAEQEKVAAEEALGARTWDYFAARFDNRIEKLAAEMILKAAEEGVQVDSTPPQAFENNKVVSSKPMDTTPAVTDEMKAKNTPHTVGTESQKTAAAALRKHFLLSQIED